MGLNWAEHSEDVDAPIETCFEAITDYESFPRWQDAVEQVEVLSRTPEGLGEDVKLYVDAKVRKIDYTLKYGYRRPEEITWDFVEGNGMRDVDGVYTLESLGPDRTRATYKLGADPAIPVPGMVLRRTHKQLVKRSVEDLKRESERRHTAGEGAETATPDVPPSGEGEPAPAAAPPLPADDWVPKAEREAASSGTGTSTRSDAPRADGGSHADLAGELLGKVVETGRGVAEGAARAGLGVAAQVLETGVSTVNGLLRRVNDKLGDRNEPR
jgi:ribosome-associated toxin RatA of RatAB toxin-antitoxin module